MATVAEVKKLAELARIRINDADLEKFTSEFDAILAYVGQLEKLDMPVDITGEKPPVRNVMRIDGEPHPTGAFTEKVAEQFPARDGDALAVKQIITHD
jgi:aspartyl/glutamyl-tRNA(Asn/Gln) amidotransferase C subunit